MRKAGPEGAAEIEPMTQANAEKETPSSPNSLSQTNRSVVEHMASDYYYCSSDTLPLSYRQTVRGLVHRIWYIDEGRAIKIYIFVSTQILKTIKFCR